MLRVNRHLSISRLAIIFLLFFVLGLLLCENIHADVTSEYSYTIPVTDNTVPRGGSKLYYVTISGAPSNAVLTNVEAKFDYIAYNGVQSYVSCRFNRGSDPGSTGGVVLVNQGSL